MGTMDVFEMVKEIIVNQLEVKGSQVIPEAKFVDDLGADSLDIVEMLMSLEDKFKIEIPDEDAEKLITVQDVIDYLSQRLGREEKRETAYSI